LLEKFNFAAEDITNQWNYF